MAALIIGPQTREGTARRARGSLLCWPPRHPESTLRAAPGCRRPSSQGRPTPVHAPWLNRHRREPELRRALGEAAANARRAAGLRARRPPSPEESPTTSGTSTSGRPALTQYFAVCPRVSVPPALGSWCATWPAAKVADRVLRESPSRPASASDRRACALVGPRSAGTATCSGPGVFSGEEAPGPRGASRRRPATPFCNPNPWSPLGLVGTIWEMRSTMSLQICDFLGLIVTRCVSLVRSRPAHPPG